MSKLENINYIIDEFNKCNITLTEAQADQFNTFYEMLVEKNKVMNLTGITEFPEVVRKHFIDSVVNIKLKGDEKILDVGTGAGFPGIPLKILFPSLKITLLDSLNKRLIFIDEVIKALNIKDVELIHGRAEDFGHDPKYREKYDVVVSRAVANLSTLSEYCLPYVKVGGKFISYKGTAAEELAAASSAVKILGGDEKNISVDEFTLSGSEDKRMLIYITKKFRTAKNYPRKAGVPSKEPL